MQKTAMKKMNFEDKASMRAIRLGKDTRNKKRMLYKMSIKVSIRMRQVGKEKGKQYVMI